jgi:hypothetical protein
VCVNRKERLALPADHKDGVAATQTNPARAHRFPRRQGHGSFDISCGGHFVAANWLNRLSTAAAFTPYGDDLAVKRKKAPAVSVTNGALPRAARPGIECARFELRIQSLEGSQAISAEVSL